MEKKKARVLLFDIEASHLKANMGFVFCIGYKWLDEKKVHLISIRDFPGHYKKDRCSDRRVLQEFAKIYAQADVVVSWFGSLFDVPYINTRNMLKKLPPLPEKAHIDGWRISRYRFCLTSNRLDTLTKIIPVKGARALKTEVDFEHWTRAMAGYREAIKYIEDHCIKDIWALQSVYKAIVPFASNLPNIGKFLDPKRENCPACASTDTNKQGFKLTATGKKQQYQCQACGHWFQGKLAK